MKKNPLLQLPQVYSKGDIKGIPSICSAHPFVIEAALQNAKNNKTHVLIEATSNQVNHEGGYTGMSPADFRKFVEKIADKVGFQKEHIILGGDHLGPNPWKHLPAEEAMNKALAMVDSYSKAGFSKIHLDASMACAGDPVALSDEVIAERATRMAKVCEEHEREIAPVYIIGTEVPVPGGAAEALDHLEVTSPEAAEKTFLIHQETFQKHSLHSAFERVIGLVVQPGVEFGHENVIAYIPEKAQTLSSFLKKVPQIIFEAHSTDYQPETALSALVQDGFSILKVGPWLTFAMREALYGLDLIAQEMSLKDATQKSVKDVMEQVMLASPDNWKKYYPGNSTEQRLLRHYSYSDRIRYYWPQPQAQQSVQELLTQMNGVRIPETLISQYLSSSYQNVMRGECQPFAQNLIISSVSNVIDIYARAARQIVC